MNFCRKKWEKYFHYKQGDGCASLTRASSEAFFLGVKMNYKILFFMMTGKWILFACLGLFEDIASIWIDKALSCLNFWGEIVSKLYLYLETQINKLRNEFASDHEL